MDGGPGDFNGNASVQFAGAILRPFADRIRGLPAGERTLRARVLDRQARPRIPARQLALVNNCDGVFPTGKLASVSRTEYDFWPPAARYRLWLIAASPQIRAFHVCAPAGKAILALAPQFNLADPYSRVWGQGVDTGMVTLLPGQSVEYSVRLELFVRWKVTVGLDRGSKRPIWRHFPSSN